MRVAARGMTRDCFRALLEQKFDWPFTARFEGSQVCYEVTNVIGFGYPTTGALRSAKISQPLVQTVICAVFSSCSRSWPFS